MHIDTALANRVALAVASGIGVGLLLYFEEIFDWPAGGIAFYAASGLVFAAGVLFPYLRDEDYTPVRALALAFASAVSYYTAVWVVSDSPLRYDDRLVFTVASIIGVAIVMTAFVLATRARPSIPYILLGLVAGAIGGPVTYATLMNDVLTIVLTGYAAWHVLVCLAIYYGTRTQRQREAFYKARVDVDDR